MQSAWHCPASGLHQRWAAAKSRIDPLAGVPHLRNPGGGARSRCSRQLEVTPDELAELLREAHPDAEPTEVEPLIMDLWFERLGVDTSDDDLVSAAIVAWERLMV